MALFKRKAERLAAEEAERLAAEEATADAHSMLYLEEARSRLDRARVRSASLDTRAGLLISSTAIASGLQVIQAESNAATEARAIAAIFALLAIILGLLVLRAGTGGELDGRYLRGRIVEGAFDPFQDRFWVADKHYEHARAHEALMREKAIRLNWGFICLALAVAFAMML